VTIGRRHRAAVRPPGSLRGVIDVPPDRFDELVGDALDSIPDELAALMDNVAVVVEEGRADGPLLGLYEGIPLTERDAWYGSGGLVMPDRVTIFRLPTCAHCGSEDEVVEQVRVTVVHEIAHHFGIDDARLDALGWA
jgi:predicted Zn-dependent protease with MMP-like domain